MVATSMLKWADTTLVSAKKPLTLCHVHFTQCTKIYFRSEKHTLATNRIGTDNLHDTWPDEPVPPIPSGRLSKFCSGPMLLNVSKSSIVGRCNQPLPLPSKVRHCFEDRGSFTALIDPVYKTGPRGSTWGRINEEEEVEEILPRFRFQSNPSDIEA